MTQPAAPRPAAAPAPPPNPKIQCIDFALQLAITNSSVMPAKITSAQQIVDDAKTFATFIGRNAS